MVYRIFKKKNLIKKLIIIGALCISIALCQLADLDDRIFYAFSSLTNSQSTKTKEIWLNDYIIDDSHVITCLDNNLSGITYSRPTNSLFVVINGPASVYELDMQGFCLRHIPLNGFIDPEGIVFLNEKKFAIIEEGRHRLNIIEIDNTTTSIDRSKVIKHLQVNLKDLDNKGFEGIAYDNDNKCFYLVSEKRPMQLITIKGLLDSAEGLSISIKPDIIPHKLYMDDFSGLHFDPATHHLLFVSDESKSVSEVSPNGKMISFMELEKGFSGLQNDIPQAEGITMDDFGNIYIVSEPNLFYKFVKK